MRPVATRLRWSCAERPTVTRVPHVGVILLGIGALWLANKYLDLERFWDMIDAWGGPVAFILLGLVLIFTHIKRKGQRTREAWACLLAAADSSVIETLRREGSESGRSLLATSAMVRGLCLRLPASSLPISPGALHCSRRSSEARCGSFCLREPRGTAAGGSR